jgi:hypothetical protein
MTVTMQTSAPRAGQFDHVGLLYHDRQEYAAHIVAFVRQGLAAGEPVLVATPDANLHLIRAGFGQDAAGVQLRDMSVAGRNPGRIIPEVLWGSSPMAAASAPARTMRYQTGPRACSILRCRTRPVPL